MIESPRNQILFIVSHPHSGSTWLSYVMGSHPRAATLGEHHRRFEGDRRIDCRHCETLGLAQCEVLHGIASTPVAEAYSMPFQRFSPQGISTLVDNSKRTSWLRRLMAEGACSEVSVRVIHLTRDPRGWIASVLSRRPADSADRLLQQWKSGLVAQEAELRQLDLPVLRLNYDLMCLDPVVALSLLSGFSGLEYGLEHYEFWKRVHHSMGANGASINVLPERRGVTPNREYYLSRLHTIFHDDRWRHREDAESLARLSDDAEADRLLEDFGGGFSAIDRLFDLRVRRANLQQDV